MTNKFKIGDVVVCLNKIGQAVELTINKTYRVIGVSADAIRIINDCGFSQAYWNSRFILVEQEITNSKPVYLNKDGKPLSDLSKDQLIDIIVSQGSWRLT